MRQFIILVLLFTTVTAVQAQEQKPKLKDLLYSGKLKKDSTGVVRSTDDLSTKIDTSTKKEVAPVPDKPVITAPVPATAVADSAVDYIEATKLTDSIAGANAVAAGPAKSNTRLWKEYTDSLQTVLKAEVLTSKQIKKDTYFMTLDYEIGLDGTVTVYNILSTPSNSFLTAQIQQYIDNNPPRLNPQLDSNGQPKKIKRKQRLTVTKD